ncbi:Uncharacterized membrane protein [Massilia yuzhufengensis]|uniref:Uncharacterized membrane protein n=1 Tax=Massilia yuzhufengensis TaxID=1164594 RepID=A0A1I1UT25_9BURK|nr:Uncharacterized membrane protein [Massilia yuzhufengensis]
MLPGWLRYSLSYVYVGIYWVNHHALLDRVERVDGRALWANLHLLFWISLIPFVTAWAGEHPMDPGPVSLYGVVLLLCSVAFMLLAASLRGAGASHPDLAWDSRKNRLSIFLYALAVAVSVWMPPFGALIHVVLALLWLRPAAARAVPEAESGGRRHS